MFVELVSPTMVNQPDGSTCKVFPNMYRSALGKYLGQGGDQILLRVVAINSYYFHLLVPRDDLSQGDFDRVVNRFGKMLKGVVRLTRGLNAATLHTSPQDGIRSMIPHLTMYQEQYRKFFAKKNPAGS